MFDRVDNSSHGEDPRRSDAAADVRTLHEVSLAVNSTLDIEQLLPQILDTITSLNQFELLQKRGGIFLVEGDRMRLLYYLGDLQRMQEFIDLHEGMKVGDCLCGLAAQRGEIVTSADSHHERLHSLVYPGIGPHGHVVVPLKARGKVVAVMALYLPVATELDPHLLDLLRLIGDQLGTAIDNAQHYQREKATRARIESYANRLSLLNEITLALHDASDWQFIVRLILSGAAELTDAGLATLTTISKQRIDENFIFEARAVDQGLSLVEDWTVDATALTEALRLLKRRPTVAGNSETLNSWLPQYFLETDSLLLGGIYDYKQETQALLLLGHKQGGAPFSPDDEELISLLLAQGASAILNAQNFANQSRTAEVLQSALLPVAPEKAGLDLGLIYRSADRDIAQIGGDFYDFIELDENRLAILIGDASGRGLPAAQYVAMIKYMLHALLKEGNDPGQCLTKLNEAIFAEIPEDRFVTACLLVFDLENKLVTFANAGHFLPLVIKAERQASSSLNSGIFVPLGVLSEQVYPTTQASTEELSAFVLFSDGVIEARNASRQVFGREGIIEAIAGIESAPAQELADRIIEHCHQFTVGQLNDDVTLIVVNLVEEPAETGFEWLGLGI